MAEKKYVYETEVTSLPPLRLMLGDVPVSDPEEWRNSTQRKQKLNPEMEGTVKRLIAYLKDNK